MAVAPRFGPFLGGGLGGALLHWLAQPLGPSLVPLATDWGECPTGAEEPLEDLAQRIVSRILTTRFVLVVLVLALVGIAFLAGLVVGCLFGFCFWRHRGGGGQDWRLNRLQGFAPAIRRHA